MQEILRWCISRIYGDQKLVKGRYQFIEIKIIPINKTNKKIPKDFTTEKSDKLEWWTKNEELFLYGYIDESTLIEAIEKRNLQPIAEVEHKLERKRRINEGNVLLQFIDIDDYLLNYMDKLRNRKKTPNLKKLANFNNSKWIDFTQQAREMASSIYEQVLEEGGEKK